MTLRMDCMCDSCVEQKYPLEPEWCITEEEQYFCGVLPPNFPVPAIPLLIEMTFPRTPDGAILDKHPPCLLIRHRYETKRYFDVLWKEQ